MKRALPRAKKAKTSHHGESEDLALLGGSASEASVILFSNQQFRELLIDAAQTGRVHEVRRLLLLVGSEAAAGPGLSDEEHSKGATSDQVSVSCQCLVYFTSPTK